jgi:alkylhydroperoxidase/carboxymuconolactone decarboxylase family protein YurZ
MTRISLDTPIDDKLRDVFAAASNNRQLPLNLHRQMLPSPAVLVAYHGMRKALDVHGVLDLRTRFALMLAVSSAEQVPYTIAVNSVLATRAGFNADEIDAIVQGHSSEDPKLDALLAVARAAAQNRGAVSEQIFQEALGAGYSERELAEAFVSIQLAAFVDHFVNYAQTPFDVPTAAGAA